MDEENILNKALLEKVKASVLDKLLALISKEYNLVSMDYSSVYTL